MVTRTELWNMQWVEKDGGKKRTQELCHLCPVYLKIEVRIEPRLSPRILLSFLLVNLKHTHTHSFQYLFSFSFIHLSISTTICCYFKLSYCIPIDANFLFEVFFLCVLRMCLCHTQNNTIQYW